MVRAKDIVGEVDENCEHTDWWTKFVDKSYTTSSVYPNREDVLGKPGYFCSGTLLQTVD